MVHQSTLSHVPAQDGVSHLLLGRTPGIYGFTAGAVSDAIGLEWQGISKLFPRLTGIARHINLLAANRGDFTGTELDGAKLCGAREFLPGPTLVGAPRDAVAIAKPPVDGPIRSDQGAAGTAQVGDLRPSDTAVFGAVDTPGFLLRPARGVDDESLRIEDNGIGGVVAILGKGVANLLPGLPAIRGFVDAASLLVESDHEGLALRISEVNPDAVQVSESTQTLEGITAIGGGKWGGAVTATDPEAPRVAGIEDNLVGPLADLLRVVRRELPPGLAWIVGAPEAGLAHPRNHRRTVRNCGEQTDARVAPLVAADVVGDISPFGAGLPATDCGTEQDDRSGDSIPTQRYVVMQTGNFVFHASCFTRSSGRFIANY